MIVNLEDSLRGKRLTKVETFGHIELSPDVSESMGWEPGTEIMGSKVDDMLILQPFQPSCCICGSVFMVKEVRGMFLCQSCIDRAEKQPYYEYKGRKPVPVQEDAPDDDASVDAEEPAPQAPSFSHEECDSGDGYGEKDTYANESMDFCDYGYEDDDDQDYDSDPFMRSPK